MTMRWDPFGETTTLQQAMNQLLQDSFVPSGGARSGWNNGSRATARPMPLDVYATPEEAIVIAPDLDGPALLAQGIRPCLSGLDRVVSSRLEGVAFDDPAGCRIAF